VADIREDTELRVQLLSPEGAVVAEAATPAFCDVEATVAFDTNIEIDKVHVKSDVLLRGISLKKKVFQLRIKQSFCGLPSVTFLCYVAGAHLHRGQLSRC